MIHACAMRGGIPVKILRNSSAKRPDCYAFTDFGKDMVKSNDICV